LFIDLSRSGFGYLHRQNGWRFQQPALHVEIGHRVSAASALSVSGRLHYITIM
jgi:hypothetical protein